MFKERKTRSRREGYFPLDNLKSNRLDWGDKKGTTEAAVDLRRYQNEVNSSGLGEEREKLMESTA